MPKQQPLSEWNDTATDYPKDVCIHQLFEAQVKRTPEAIALIFEGQSLTYQELNQKANQLAHHLANLEVKTEVLVGVSLERSAEMIIGILGILKAGGAYLPLDPEYPKERLVFMLTDANVSIIITQQHLSLQNLLQEHDPTMVYMDSDWENISQHSENNFVSQTEPNDLAYCIYTSGSTGKPKGVLLEHRGLCNLAMAQIYAFGIEPDSRVLQFASINFDASISEIVMTLISGATLCLGTQDTLLPGSHLLQFLQENAITVATLPPSVLTTLAAKQLTTLQTVIVAGEACSAELVAQHTQERRFFNAYGPTETTVCATIAECQDPNAKPPIGFPIANVQVYILDEQMQQVPVGVNGELHIGGVGLARGYLNRPELTSEKFVPNPFSDDSRLYKTGDLACYLPDGNIEFVGRIDHQVKIRGFRIELGEIEAKLHQHSDIRDVVVIAREDTPGNKQLVAYVIVHRLARQRIPMRSECELICMLTNLEKGLVRKVFTEDVSYDGVGISGLQAGCMRGQRLKLSFRLPTMPPNKRLRIEGNIAWLDNYGRGGIHFDSNSDDERQLHKAINDFFEKRGMFKVLQNTFIDRTWQFLRNLLPEYMIPSHFVLLDEFPLTPSSKVDRKVLPPPDLTRPDLYTAVEEALLKIWATVLGLERVGLHDNFLHLGGNSLLAAQIISRVNELFQVKLPLYTLFDLPTVAELAELAETPLHDTSCCLPLPPVEHVTNYTDIPLSFVQQQLWLLAQFLPDVPVYNEPLVIRLGGPIDAAVLEKSIKELVCRHESLRTTFTTNKNGHPIQIISSSITFNLPVVNLSEFPPGTREDKYIRLATQEAKQPFDLVNGPLFRAILLRLDETDYRLCLTLHHIIFDGISLYNVLFPELAILYQAFASGKPSPLSELAIQYTDYVLWQHQWLKGEVIDTYLSYWRRQLADLPTLQLPTDSPRSALQTYNGASHCLSLSKELTEGLKNLSKQENVTLFITLLAAFRTLLYRYSGQIDFPIGTVMAGRNHAEIEKIVGVFLNTVVLRANLSGNPTFKQLLKRVQKVTLEAYANENLPFEILVKTLHPQRELTANPLFQVAFIFEPSISKIDLDWTIDQYDIHTGTSKFDLTLSLDEKPEEIVGRIEYNTDLFDETTILRIAGHYQTLLKGVVADPEQHLLDLPLLTIKEQQQLENWSKSPQYLCVHQLFEIQVDRTPNAIALVFDEQQFTYQELNQQANQLANYLIDLGVKPDTLVGISVERSAKMLIGLLGILKAGGAYVPLDPSYPEERLNFMLKDGQINTLITQVNMRTKLSRSHLSIICLDSEWQDIATKSTNNPINTATPNNLAYVIYTSGSTGKPKGVQICHRSVVNFLLSMQHTPGLTSQDTLLAITTISFDIAVLELYLPLITGAKVVLASRAIAVDGSKLLATLESSKATVMQATPATWRMLLSVGWLGSSFLKILVGGEALTHELADKLLTKGKSVWNLYGPTEATVWSTIHKVDVNRPLADNKVAPEPIGYPIANTQIYVLDHNLRRVPTGIPGELHISGIGLARGYLNHPELTAEKFISHPFSYNQEERIYKTGDLVRYRSDGNIEFLGRIDHQVKVRGFRIELEEIEETLRQYPTINEVVIIVREDVPDDRRITAYFTEQGKHNITELRHFLVKKLPNYMIPSAFISLKSLPLTPNGKVDRKALPQPKGLQRDAKISHVSPRSELEQTIATIWQELLNVKEIGIQDTFFDLGGHSLLLVQLRKRLAEVLQRSISVSILFQYPTIQAFAQYLTQSPEEVVAKSTPARASKRQVAISRQKQRREARKKD